VLVLVSIVPLFYGAGVVYFVAALVLGGLLVEKVLKARQRRDEGSFRTLFGFSIIYLFALFAVMVADALLPWGHLLG
jgi:protoheme IX farnesyltransferase